VVHFNVYLKVEIVHELHQQTSNCDSKTTENDRKTGKT